MKNEFEVRGEVTVIKLKRKDGSVTETMIDTVDLARVRLLPGAWHASHVGTASYVEVYAPKGMETPARKIRLHRFLTNAPIGYVVDHINGDPLDNRRSNLRVVTNAENLQNQSTSKRSKSGIRGVRWVPETGKFRAEYRLNGKSIHVGLFETEEEADRAVSEARAKAMPFSQDAMRAPHLAAQVAA